MSETRRVPGGERAGRKRQAIVRAAREVFLEEGFPAGMDRIAERAGVSKVTVYNHFGSKEQLFVSVVGEALDQALGAAFEAAPRRLAQEGDIRQAFVALAQAWVRGMTEADVLALRRLVTHEVARFPALGRAWREAGPNRFAPLLAEALGDLTDRGELEVPDPGLAVTQLYALVLYPHFVHDAYGDRLDAGTTEKLITGGVDMFLAHYRATPPGGARAG